MPRVSRRPVSKNVHLEMQDNFDFLISSLNEHLDIQMFTENFFTKEEKVMLIKRLMLHMMFENGYKTTEIAAVLSVSRETIRTHKLLWSTSSNSYRSLIHTLARRDKTKQFWKRVERILKPLDLAFRAKNDMKARHKLMTGDFD